jgi:hypothetical protein
VNLANPQCTHHWLGAFYGSEGLDLVGFDNTHTTSKYITCHCSNFIYKGKMIHHLSLSSTNYMEQNRSWEMNSCLGGQEIHHLLWNQRFISYHQHTKVQLFPQMANMLLYSIFINNYLNESCTLFKDLSASSHLLRLHGHHVGIVND